MEFWGSCSYCCPAGQQDSTHSSALLGGTGQNRNRRAQQVPRKPLFHQARTCGKAGETCGCGWVTGKGTTHQVCVREENLQGPIRRRKSVTQWDICKCKAFFLPCSEQGWTEALDKDIKKIVTVQEAEQTQRTMDMKKECTFK